MCCYPEELFVFRRVSSYYPGDSMEQCRLAFGAGQVWLAEQQYRCEYPATLRCSALNCSVEATGSDILQNTIHGSIGIAHLLGIYRIQHRHIGWRLTGQHGAHS